MAENCLEEVACSLNLQLTEKAAEQRTNQDGEDGHPLPCMAMAILDNAHLVDASRFKAVVGLLGVSGYC